MKGLKKSIVAIALTLLVAGGIGLFVLGENPPIQVQSSVIENA